MSQFKKWNLDNRINDLNPHKFFIATVYLRPLYSKQCLIGDRLSPMVPFAYVDWQLSWWDNHLSVTMEGGLIPPGQTSTDMH